jgi:hypothetical protein
LNFMHLSPTFWIVNLVFAISILKDPKIDKLEDLVNGPSFPSYLFHFRYIAALTALLMAPISNFSNFPTMNMFLLLS